MANDRVILKLDGSVSAADFRTVVNAFTDLIASLTSEVNADAAVEWIIDDLKGGSALIVNRGISGNAEGAQTVERVVARYEFVARDANEKRFDRMSETARRSIFAISSVVNGRIPRVHMGTDEDPDIATIETQFEAEEVPPATERPPQLTAYSRTAIKGQIVTLDEKHGTYFTLRTAYGGNDVRCWPGPAHRAKLGAYWDQKTWVIVEGTYARYGDRPTLTDITDIVPLPDGEKGGWRQAIGCAPRGPESQDITSAEAVRRIRDEET